MTNIKTATRFIQEYDPEKFQTLLGQATQDIAKLGFEPKVSLSHVTGGPGLFHYAAVITGAKVE